MHSQSLRARNIKQKKLDTLAGWRLSDAFDQREKTALEWAEAVTELGRDSTSDQLYEKVKSVFSDVEISDLTFAISLMNTFNRLAVSMKQ